MEISFHCNAVPGHQIATTFCTCHNNIVVVSCAKSCTIISLVFGWEQTECSIEFKLWWKNYKWNGSHGSRSKLWREVGRLRKSPLVQVTVQWHNDMKTDSLEANLGSWIAPTRCNLLNAGPHCILWQEATRSNHKFKTLNLIHIFIVSVYCMYTIKSLHTTKLSFYKILLRWQCLEWLVSSWSDLYLILLIVKLYVI